MKLGAARGNKAHASTDGLSGQRCEKNGFVECALLDAKTKPVAEFEGISAKISKLVRD